VVVGGDFRQGKYMNITHQRRSLRLKEYDYSSGGAYFITICTKDRKCLFGEIKDNQMVLNEFGEIAKHFWLEMPHHFPNVELDEFVLMPNHIHGIIIIHDQDARMSNNPAGKNENSPKTNDGKNIETNNNSNEINDKKIVGAIHELPLQMSMNELSPQSPNNELPTHDNKIQRRKMIVPKIVGFFKMNTAKKINQILNTMGQPVWQRNYYEHIIRNEKSLHQIRQYITNNPSQWNLDTENPLAAYQEDRL
jgi:REP element-mobilizing transposase RayT